MYSLGVAGNIGTVYTDAEMLQGKAPGAGTKGVQASSSGTQEFLMCRVALSQNLVRGNLVTIDGSFVATITAAGAPGPLVRARVGVAVCTVTASQSAGIWVQVYGVGQVVASVSCEPNSRIAAGVVAGQVDDVAASTSAIIEGMWTTASTGAATGLVACVLNYPVYGTN